MGGRRPCSGPAPAARPPDGALRRADRALPASSRRLVPAADRARVPLLVRRTPHASPHGGVRHAARLLHGRTGRGRRLLSRDPRPDAVIGVYSDSGHNILAAARRHGLRVPRDLLVACVSEDPAYATSTPPVTTLSLRPDRLGAEAVDLLIAVINACGGVDRRRLVQPVLVRRRSTRRAVRRGNGTP
ncbi:substrate-binding domain-containing protein [Streptomyces sp. NPDC019990]|uniref:substrate-binding domain-containing protein n=1 Tax=Streptomyces sp. NPDC019990 TaxID=3154693 RepID=UPI0033D4155B